MGAFAAQAGFLDPAKWCGGIGNQPFVDADHAAFQCFCHAPAAVDIVAVEVCCQPVRGVVGNADGVFFGFKGNDGRQRPEGFVLAELGIGGNAGDQRGLNEAAAPFVALATGDDPGALAQCIFQMLHDFIGGAPVDKGSLGNAFFKAIAYFHGFDGNLEFLHKGIVDAFLYQETVHAHAGLAGVAKLAGHGAFHGFIQVGIVEHQKGGVAAQFQ